MAPGVRGVVEDQVVSARQHRARSPQLVAWAGPPTRLDFEKALMFVFSTPTCTGLYKESFDSTPLAACALLVPQCLIGKFSRQSW